MSSSRAVTDANSMKAESEMRVLVADDQAAGGQNARRLLKEEPGLIVVGEVVRADELLDQAAATQPDLVLLDCELCGLYPSFRPTAGQARWRLLDALHRLRSHPKVIVLSGRPEMRQAALDAGADAFVSKGDSPEQLLTTLHIFNMACDRLKALD
jgi:DNA-binding NarL/FixJ family response regulator